MDKKLILAIIILILATIGGYLLLHTDKPTESKQSQSEVKKSASPNEPKTIAPSLYYPMTDYTKRVTFRWYGKSVSSNEASPVCGARFSGLHVADDLEIINNESISEVPVYSISKGVVSQIGFVSGYGGLLVVSSNISGADYTVYYGHIDLGSTGLKKGDTIEPGQHMANLGDACTTETDGERKHLHFSIRKGNGIDVRGYVPNTTQLASWLNPKTFLEQNQAAGK